MTTFSTKLIIDSVVHKFNQIGKSLYIVKIGDKQRGLLYIKTIDKHNTQKFAIHYRQYNFNSDRYEWITINNLDEVSADNKLNQFINSDSDCWVIEVEDYINPFSDIL